MLVQPMSYLFCSGRADRITRVAISKGLNFLGFYLKPNSSYRAARLQTSNGFFCSVNHLSGGGVMQITMQRTRPAWPAKTKLRVTLDCLRIAEEIAMISGLFVEGRRQTLLYSFKRQYEISEKSSKKTSQLLPETGRSQATNLETQKQTKWIEMHQSQVNICFLRGLLR